MKWIIEAGTTKTDSVFVSRDCISEIRSTDGLNPVSDNQFVDKLKHLCVTSANKKVDEIYYYGSGCINKEINKNIENIIAEYMEGNNTIQVYDDLMGAAIGTCGKNPGIAAILGTGSNIGYFDGIKITDTINSCGYLLGDEGGGYRIGQNLYLRFCRSLLNEDETRIIETGTGVSIEQSVGNLYAQQNPRQYLASISKYIGHMSEETKKVIVGEVFDDMIQHLILPIWNKHKSPIHFVGSIAFHFQDYLVDMFRKFNIIAGSFKKSPIEGIINYHRYE